VPTTKRRPCAKCGRNRAEKFYTSAKGRTCLTCRRGTRSHASRSVRLTQTYGIDPAEYTMILHEQDFRCAICRRQPRYNLDVDHDHKSGAVRGLLCKLCNRRLLPSVKDDVALLWSAVRYLEDPPADRALGRRVIVPGSIA
jgi:hypothetical protein